MQTFSHFDTSRSNEVEKTSSWLHMVKEECHLNFRKTHPETWHDLVMCFLCKSTSCGMAQAPEPHAMPWWRTLSSRQDPNEVRHAATGDDSYQAMNEKLYDRSNHPECESRVESCKRFCWLIFPKNLFGSRHCFSRTGRVVFERFIPRPVGAAKCAREANIFKLSKHSCLTDVGQTSKLL